MKLYLVLLLSLVFSISSYSQLDAIKVRKSSVYRDDTKFSTLKFAQKNGEDGVVIIRSFHKGMPSVYHDYMLEVYDKDLKLKKSQRFEFGTSHFSAYNDKIILGFFIKDHVINMITLEFNKESRRYDCLAYKGSVEQLDFSKSTLFSIEKNELESQGNLSGHYVNYTGVLKNLFFNEDQSAFCVILDLKKNKKYGKGMYMFDADLNKVAERVVMKRAKEYHCNIFDVNFTNDKQLYLLWSIESESKEEEKTYGRGYYEITRLSPDSELTSSAVLTRKNGGMIFPKLIADKNAVYCLGLKVDKEDQYNGYSFYSFDSNSLAMVNSSHKEFSYFFMEKQGWVDKKKEVYANFVIKKLGFSQNGNLYMIFEHKTIGAESGMCFAGKLNVFVFSKEGELLKENVFVKGQTDFRTNNFEYASFTTFQKNDDLYFISNFENFGKKDEKGNIVYNLSQFNKSSMFAVKYNMIDNDFMVKELVKNSNYQEKVARAMAGIVCDNSIFLLGGIKSERTLYELTF